MKKILVIIMILVLVTAFAGCGQKQSKTEITVLAAASLTDVCDELKTAFEEETGDVTLNFSFGGSGALQAQIEEGAPGDIFISAAERQMDELRAVSYTHLPTRSYEISCFEWAGPHSFTQNKLFRVGETPLVHTK